MGCPYNTRTWEKKSLFEKRRRQRAIEAKEHRVSSQRSQRPFKLNKHLTFTTMAPPKQAEASQTARKPELEPGHEVQLEEGEQQPPEIVNVDEIPSPDTTPVNPTPIVEETQQPTPRA
jgi:hypothetical protein